MAIARNGSLRIHWESSGEGEPVLMIMGLAASHEGWYRFTPYIADRYRAILPDNRGTGLSDKPWRAFSASEVADDAIAVLDAAGVDRAHVIGGSFGGMVAQHLTLNYPERVKSLLLGGTTASYGEMARIDLRTTAGMAMRPLVGFKRALPIIAPAIYGKQTLIGSRERVEEDLRQRIQDATPARTSILQMLAVRGHDTRKRLHEIETPTLIAHGSEDGLVPPSCAYTLARGIRNSELAIFPGAGHIITTDVEQELAQMTLNFLGRHSSTTKESSTEEPLTAVSPAV